jgi:pyruvate kinase
MMFNWLMVLFIVTIGQKFTFYTEGHDLPGFRTGNVAGDVNGVTTSYKFLASTVVPGDVILVDDGLIGMKVVSVDSEAGTVECVVENDGVLGETKGMFRIR